MKTLLNVCIAILVGFVSIATPKNDDPEPEKFNENNHYQTKTRSFGVVMYPKKDALVMNVMVDNYSSKSIIVQLKDEKGELYFSTSLGKRQRRSWLKLNMGDLKDAVYQLVIFNGKDKVVKEINLKTLKVPLPEPKMEEQRLISML